MIQQLEKCITVEDFETIGRQMTLNSTKTVDKDDLALHGFRALREGLFGRAWHGFRPNTRITTYGGLTQVLAEYLPHFKVPAIEPNDRFNIVYDERVIEIYRRKSFAQGGKMVHPDVYVIGYEHSDALSRFLFD